MSHQGNEHQPEQHTSLVEGLGCCLLVMGVVGTPFGLAALFGISDRIELEFFDIPLNDTTGRLIWVTGCLIAAVAGFLILRSRSRSRSG